MNDEQNNNDEIQEATETDEVSEANVNSDDGASDSAEEEKDWKAEVEKWRSNSRKNEATAKENYKKLTELTSEFETLRGQLTEAEKVREENLNLTKRLVIAETGLPIELSARLNGTTEEELKKDAESLMELFGQVKKTPRPIKAQGSDLNSDFKPVFKTQEEYTQYYKNK